MFTDYLTDLLAPVVTRCILEMLLSFLHSHVNSQKYSQTKVHSYTFLCHFFIDVLLPVKEKHFVRLIMNCIVYVRQKQTKYELNMFSFHLDLKSCKMQNKLHELELAFFFTSSYPTNDRGSIVLRSNFRNGYLMNLYVMRFPEFENHIFNLFACVYVRLCIYISITRKQITEETSNLIFYTCIICRYYLKLFIKIEQKLFVQGHSKNPNTLRPVEGISYY